MSNSSPSLLPSGCLTPHMAALALRTRPHMQFECSLDLGAGQPPGIARLLSADLVMGAVIRGPPAIGREFRAIDFLTCVDQLSLAILAMQQRGRFFV